MIEKKNILQLFFFIFHYRSERTDKHYITILCTALLLPWCDCVKSRWRVEIGPDCEVQEGTSIYCSIIQEKFCHTINHQSWVKVKVAGRAPKESQLLIQLCLAGPWTFLSFPFWKGKYGFSVCETHNFYSLIHVINWDKQLQCWALAWRKWTFLYWCLGEWEPQNSPCSLIHLNQTWNINLR